MGKSFLSSDNMEFEHQRWKGEISFWKNELESFNSKLSELITRWADMEELAEGVIEELLESIEQKEMRISSLNNSNNLRENSVLSEKHIELRNRMETQREVYAELKKNIFRFLE